MPFHTRNYPFTTIKENSATSFLTCYPACRIRNALQRNFLPKDAPQRNGDWSSKRSLGISSIYVTTRCKRRRVLPYVLLWVAIDWDRAAEMMWKDWFWVLCWCWYIYKIVTEELECLSNQIMALSLRYYKYKRSYHNNMPVVPKGMGGTSNLHQTPI